MRKLFLCATIAVAMCFASCEGFDASEILDRLDNLENQLDDLKNNEENNQGGDNSDNPGVGDDIPADKTQAITFADPTTKLICILQWDENEDGELSYEEAAAVTDLGTAVKGSSILAFTELKYFTSLEKIADNAFEGCVSLVKITLPEQLTIIGTSAFNGCTNLKKIAIPNAVTEIGGSAFSGCTSLTSVDISDLSAWCKISFDRYDANPLYYAKQLYLNGSELTDITIPSDITEIKSYAFYKCTSLTSVTIPNSVTSIGGSVFSGCTSLTSVTIPDSVTSIGGSAFYNCTSLTSVPIPDSVTSIGDYAFYDCTSLTSITIGNSVTSIGGYTFSGCTSLTSVTIGKGVTEIGESAFENCTSLTSVYCKPTTPPAIYYYYFHYSFPHNEGMKIYVPRDSYDAYMQYSSPSYDQVVQTNWYMYEKYIEPYDFE